MPEQRTGRRERFRTTVVLRAREMRKNQTPAERKLWSALRGDQICGLRFRRQHRIGSYIADFFCDAAGLVIELDGASHDERKEYDAKRTYWISKRGLDAIRFSNEEVMGNLDGVLVAIESLCSSVAGPSPQ